MSSSRKPVRPLAVGITGSMGSGKSLLLSLLRKRGVPVLSADEVGRRFLKRREITRKVLRAFGEDVRDSRGCVDRKKLAKTAFSSPLALQKLNRILQPIIRRRIAEWIKEKKSQTHRPILAVEVPLLFEGRFEGLFDEVVSVSAPHSLRAKRRGLPGLRQREKYQWSQAAKDRRADWVVRNVSTKNELEFRAKQLLDSLSKRSQPLRRKKRK